MLEHVALRVEVLHGQHCSVEPCVCRDRREAANQHSGGAVAQVPQFEGISPGRGSGRLHKMRLHDARHTYATLQLEGDVHPTVVSWALGHSSPAFTAAFYAHVTPSHTQSAAAVIDAALSHS